MAAQENDNSTPESQNTGGGAFDQADIDSMFGSDDSTEATANQGAESAQHEPSDDEPNADAPAIDQSSIDAMFGGDDSEGDAGSSDEPSAASDPVEDGRLDTLGRPFDAAAAEMAAAIAEEKEAAEAAAASAPPPPPVDTQAVDLQDFGEHGDESIDPKKVSMLSDVKLRVRVELGRSRMLVEEVLQLGEGSVVELQKAAGDPVDIIVNERLIARGEVLVLNDNFCVRISEIVATDPHRVTV